MDAEEQQLLMDVLQSQHREEHIMRENGEQTSGSAGPSSEGPADAQPKRKVRIRAGRVVQAARLKGALKELGVKLYMC